MKPNKKLRNAVFSFMLYSILTGTAFSQETNFDGVYVGESKGVDRGCTGSQLKREVKNNALEWRIGSPSGLVTSGLLPIDKSGNFNGQIGSATIKGVVSGNKIVGQTLNRECSFTINLTKQ